MLYDHYTPWRHWWLQEMQDDRPADFWVSIGIVIFVIVATTMDADWGKIIIDLFQ